MGMNQTTGSSGYGSTGTTGGTFGSSTSDGYNNEPVHNSSVLNKLDVSLICVLYCFPVY